MAKSTGLPSPKLSAPKKYEELRLSPTTLSPRLPASLHTIGSTPTSPVFPPGSSSFAIQQIPTVYADDQKAQNTAGPASPYMTAVPEVPPSPDTASSRHGRDTSKSFFSNLMASKSTHKLNALENGTSIVAEKANARSRASSKDRSLRSLRRQGSTPELPRSNHTPSDQTQTVHDPAANSVTAEHTQASIMSNNKKGRSMLGGILTRTRTVKHEEMMQKRGLPPSQLSLEPASAYTDPNDSSPKTAPIRSDYRERAFGSENGSATRNRSADRQVREEALSQKKGTSGSLPPSHSLHVLSNIGHTGKGMGDRLGKAGKGLFGKMIRSGSSTEREPVTDDTYVCTTINLPLVKQTRKTRIAKRLERSRDKTEFWMPALPWRCIDYLNMNGCEEEGLYRIPGSGKDVKHWQRRFDTEQDINLFEEEDLYDINTIGSMFKSWLRDLPDEVLPKSIQNKVSAQCAGATRTPQLLKDELSKLPPFNYYLLFAITCHLSLLNSFADKNKMDYRNLCICFQPCLKIDAFCFQFLVMDWKSCWQGCWTEKEYLEEEYRWEREGSVNGSEDLAVDDRAISSSGSSQHVPPKTADAANQRKSTLGLNVKQRSLSTSAGNRNVSGGSAHTAAQSMPAVPRLTRTPDQQPLSDRQLPDIGNMSPIRM